METLNELSQFFRQFWGLWLMIFFLGIVAWTFWPKHKDRLEDKAKIPLEDDESEERKDGGNP